MATIKEYAQVQLDVREGVSETALNKYAQMGWQLKTAVHINGQYVLFFLERDTGQEYVPSGHDPKPAGRE